MASPGMIGGFGIGSTLIGGILGGIGKKQQDEAQSQMYAYQAQVAQINSQVDKQNADYAIVKGETQAEIAGIKGGQQLGQIKVGQAASGFDINTGSNVEVQQSQKKLTQMDTDQIRANSAKVAYDYNFQSVQDLNQSGLDTLASANASKAGDIAMMSSLVSTAGSVSDKWLAGRQSGVFASA